MKRSAAIAVALVAIAVACGHPDGAKPTPSGVIAGTPSASTSTSPSSTASPPATPEIGLQIRLEQVGTFAEPVAMATRRGDPSLYVAQKSGEVVAFRPGTRAAPRTILDISSSVTDSGESGLLGLTFSPDGAWLYVSFDDRQDDSEIVAYRFVDGRAQTPGR